ncbi:conserved hypothetical protein [Culex quinquefasciatus]|uniref:Uncharacterized protein n=1 Tax=Culex quinquefasciatus TaxID=7176 RepID=B0WQU4_CULQU|nr:conserved hypothetical protein [Culex quinquefasciatus]|eukprot:XP_001851078.1 conserved hypothetical protein [Culex quinquefasciatus]
MAAKFGIAKLDGTNWPVWEMRVEALLAVEDLWEVVMEGVPAAEKQDAAWRSCDPKAKENIVSLLVDSQRSLVEGEAHARDVFKALKEHHQQHGSASVVASRGISNGVARCVADCGEKSENVGEKDAARNTEKEIAGKTATVSIEGTAAEAAGTLEVQIAGCTEIETAESDEQDVALTTGVRRSANWVIDSGASAHMSNDRKFFSSLREFAGGYITVANGKQTEIRGEGSGVVYGIDGEEKPKKIDIGEVKFVPGLTS